MKRRTLLAGWIGTLLAATPIGRSWAQTGQQPSDLQACLSDPGVALYLALQQGQLAMTSQELLPGPTWQLFVSQATPISFYFPPDWIGQTLFASTFSPNGAPQWTTQQQSIGGIASARITAPDATALWEYAIASLQGVALTIEQGVMIAESGVLGDGVQGNRLCIHTEPTLDGGTTWFTAVEWNGSILLTNGSLYADASGFVPFSVLAYYGMGGPRTRFESLMRSVFLPIQFQLLQGYGSNPTPTPTPAF